jgi:hypothetical protein
MRAPSWSSPQKEVLLFQLSWLRLDERVTLVKRVIEARVARDARNERCQQLRRVIDGNFV